MAEELKEAFPFLYKKQARRDLANNLPIHVMFDVKQNKLQLEQEVRCGIVEPSVTVGAEIQEIFSPREEAVKYVEEREVVKVRQVDESKQQRQPGVSPHKSRKRFMFTEKNIENLDALGLEEFEFYKELMIKKQMDRLGRFNVHGKTVFYARNSLYLFNETSEFRKALVWIIEWIWFERFILFCILINSVILLAFDYEDRDSESIRNQIINVMSDVLTIIFFVEAGLKIAAFGFFMHKYSYLRDAWNVADFIIVITGIIDLMRVKLNLKALRILRVIRPLRSIKAIPSMRKLVSTLLKSLPELGNATIFIAFMIMLFSILGLQQFSGITYYRCRLTEKPVNSTYWPRSAIYTRVCSPQGAGSYTCPEGLWCGSPIDYGISIEDDGVFNDPVVHYGINSFEHFGASLIVVLQTITAENWSEIMLNHSDGYIPFFTYLYFCLIVIIGYYYMMQLLLAVIMSNLSKIMAQEEHDEIAMKKLLVQKDKENVKKMKLLKLQEKVEKRKSLHNEIQKSPGEGPITPPFIVKISDPTDRPNTNEQENLLGAHPKSDIRQSNYSGKGVNTQPNKRGSAKPRETDQTHNEDTLELEHGFKANPLNNSRFDNSSLENIRISNVGGIAAKVQPEQPQDTSQTKAIDPHAYQYDPDPEPKLKDGSLSAFEQQKLDEIIKGMFMWNLGSGAIQSQVDLSQGIGLAILSQVIGVKELENEYHNNIDKLKDTTHNDDMIKRLDMQIEMEQEFSRLVRRMDLVVAKKYQASRKIVYGIENEIHLVEQVQKLLSIMIKISPDNLTKDQLIEFILRIPYEANPQNEGLSNSFRESRMPKELKLSDQMNVSLKIAQHLREVARQQKAREFFFVRFKRQLYKKNLTEKMVHKIQHEIVVTKLEMRARKSIFYRFCYRVCESKFFNSLSMVVICVNSIVLALSSYPENPALEQLIDNINLAFFCFFMFELFVKLGGRGFALYFEEKFNWFDFSVLLVSCVDITLSNTVTLSQSGSGAITAMRVLRIIRIFRLAKVWKDLQDLLEAITHTVKDISNISVLLFIFIYTFMLIGMELYAYKVKFNPETHNIDMTSNGQYPKSNFNSSLDAFLTVFIVLANDGWAKIFYDYYRGVEPVVATIFFMSLLVFGQFIILNLFVAVLIENFELLSIRNDMVNKIHKIRELPIRERILRLCKKKDQQVHPTMSNVIDELINGELQEKKKQQDLLERHQPSLMIFKFDSNFRVKATNFVTHKFFERIMLVIIFITTLQLAVDNPLSDPNSFTQKFLFWLDLSLTIIFIMEAILKMIAYGLIFCGSTSYLRSSWNALDLIIVIISVTSLMLPTTNLNSIKVIRLMKILRPLRVISRNEGLKISIRTLGVAVPGIINVILVTCLFLYICGIIGVNYFKGRLNECVGDVDVMGPRIMELLNFVDDKWGCINSGGEWVRDFLNFDDVFNAMRTFFIVSTSVQWSDIMYRVCGIRGYDLTISDNIEMPIAALFFVVVVVIGNFFLMNLFVGVIISTYNREKELAGKDYMKSDDQKSTENTHLMFLNTKPQHKMKIPQNGFQLPFYYIAQNWFLQYFIQLCIIVNTIVMMLQWPTQSQEFQNVLDTMNSVFVCIFTGEFMIKIIGFGRRYFKDSWNIFDMIIVILTLVSIAYGTASQNSQLGPQTTVIRSFRIARIFYFFKRNKALKGTFQTFIGCLPAIANIGSLILLTMLIYSILGVYLFSEIKFNGALTVDSNFTSVGSAFLLLIRITTGERWPEMMKAVSQQYSPMYLCIKDPTYEDYALNGFKPVGCGAQYYAIIYFFSYNLVICMVFLRLFIAIILQTFKDITEKDNKFINQDLSDHFRQIWALYDPDATSFIRKNSYARFLVALGNPLGWDVTFEHNYNKQQEYLRETRLPLHNLKGYFKFMDVFEHLILLMIIRREVVHFGIKNNNLTLLNFFETEKKVFEEIHQEAVEKVKKQEVSQPQTQKNENEDAPLLNVRAFEDEQGPPKKIIPDEALANSIQFLHKTLSMMPPELANEAAISIIMNENNPIGQLSQSLRPQATEIIPRHSNNLQPVSSSGNTLGVFDNSSPAGEQQAQMNRRKSKMIVRSLIGESKKHSSSNLGSQKDLFQNEPKIIVNQHKNSSGGYESLRNSGQGNPIQFLSIENRRESDRFVQRNQYLYNSQDEMSTIRHDMNSLGLSPQSNKNQINEQQQTSAVNQQQEKPKLMDSLDYSRPPLIQINSPSAIDTQFFKVPESKIQQSNALQVYPEVPMPANQTNIRDSILVFNPSTVSASVQGPTLSVAIHQSSTMKPPLPPSQIAQMPPPQITVNATMPIQQPQGAGIAMRQKTLKKKPTQVHHKRKQSTSRAMPGNNDSHASLPQQSTPSNIHQQQQHAHDQEREEVSEYDDEYEEEVDQELERVLLQQLTQGKVGGSGQRKKDENDEMMELVDEELSKIISKDENNGQNTVHSSIKEFPWESKKDR